MTAVAIHNGIAKQTESYINELDRNIRLLKASGLLLKLTTGAFILRLKSRRVRDDIRRAIETCDGNCSNKQTCAKSFCELATSVRDKMLEMVSLSEQGRYTAPIRMMMAGPAMEWDDFVEDCTIAADPEIGKLFGQLSNTL